MGYAHRESAGATQPSPRRAMLGPPEKARRRLDRIPAKGATPKDWVVKQILAISITMSSHSVLGFLCCVLPAYRYRSA